MVERQKYSVTYYTFQNDRNHVFNRKIDQEDPLTVIRVVVTLQNLLSSKFYCILKIKPWVCYCTERGFPLQAEDLKSGTQARERASKIYWTQIQDPRIHRTQVHDPGQSEGGPQDSSPRPKAKR